MEPFGYYGVLHHIKSGERIKDMFVVGPTQPALKDLRGFKWTWTPLYEKTP